MERRLGTGLGGAWGRIAVGSSGRRKIDVGIGGYGLGMASLETVAAT